MGFSPLIRVLSANDVAEYQQLRFEALRSDPDAFGLTYEEEHTKSEQEFITILTNSLVLGAYLNNELVGMIRFQRGTEYKNLHKGTIWGFYVKPDCRGLKIGEKLIEKLVVLLEGNVKQVSLAVIEENVSAINLYKKFGFEIYGTEPMPLKNDSTYVNMVLMYLIM
ncbi:GNAT family N-acetyltransferase [Xenorhabdus cabanillasii]|uniref:GCN5-related N-acetyltransferase n=1 Tax=Xenorhabdus cabanillasii JM26 TaxID=1427517 RepID=W1J5P4_9GAMM|nr:GNAT family N-acetyltransferase [Xenorhabdus cabanillasii]PHM76078.1 acetyltransferase, gnat family [Xenorhabdus cabanillasii JM26]CDL86072.1 GCN5-related N-acetyltransferase [Xenorhabdus cabanillasii JM26]